MLCATIQACRTEQLMQSSVVDLVPVDTKDSPYHYMFRVECTSCRNQHDNWVGISQFVRLPPAVSTRGLVVCTDKALGSD